MSARPSLVQLERRRREADAASIAHKKWAHLRPRSALIYVENRCHLRCEHCYETEETHPPRYRLSLEDYDRILTELAELGALYVTFTGGEIFLRRDILDIVALARQKRFAVTLYTSGTLIDEAKADRIAELKVREVHISVYSHEPAVHDAFTKIPGSHARSVRALRLLQQRGVQTVLKANLMTFNVEHIDELIALARSVGAEFTFDPSVRARMNGDPHPQKYALSPETLRRLVLSRSDLATHFQRNAAEELCSGESALLGGSSVLCGAARETLSIGADGSVLACGFFPEAGGNLNEQSLRDIWYGSQQFDAIRETTFGRMSACGDCEVRSTCVPCMAQALIEEGDFRGCNQTSRQLATALHLLAKRKAEANRKMERGRPLPLICDAPVPRQRPMENGRLSSEP